MIDVSCHYDFNVTVSITIINNLILTPVTNVNEVFFKTERRTEIVLWNVDNFLSLHHGSARGTSHATEEVTKG